MVLALTAATTVSTVLPPLHVSPAGVGSSSLLMAPAAAVLSPVPAVLPTTLPSALPVHWDCSLLTEPVSLVPTTASSAMEYSAPYALPDSPPTLPDSV